jgi:hypothetical protein
MLVGQRPHRPYATGKQVLLGLLLSLNSGTLGLTRGLEGSLFFELCADSLEVAQAFQRGLVHAALYDRTNRRRRL